MSKRQPEGFWKGFVWGAVFLPVASGLLFTLVAIVGGTAISRNRPIDGGGD